MASASLLQNVFHDLVAQNWQEIIIGNHRQANLVVGILPDAEAL
jgi:hypothetical protein